jgi:hypothetical protein
MRLAKCKTIGFGGDFCSSREMMRVAGKPLPQLDIQANAGQRTANLMGDTRQELAQGREKGLRQA